MPLMETVSTVNSAVRTVLALVVTGGLAIGAWLGYTTINKSELELQKQEQELATLRDDLTASQAENEQAQQTIRQQTTRISQLGATVREQKEEIARLDTAMRLLKVDRRLAKLTVKKQEEDADGQLYTTVEFVEVNDEGAPIDAPQQFKLQGNRVYIEHLIVKFQDELVETGQSVSICAFHRIYGEHMEPKNGYPIDQAGSRPGAYKHGGQITKFESEIWQQFWEISNDPEKARERGIRAAHGDALIIMAKPGKTYHLTLRASGGLSPNPQDTPLTVDPV